MKIPRTAYSPAELIVSAAEGTKAEDSHFLRGVRSLSPGTYPKRRFTMLTATETAKDLTTKCPEVQIVTTADPSAHAVSLSDVELLTHLKSTFRTIRESLPYLRVARERFAAQGRKLPVPGSPTWSQWVTMNLHVTVRTVQRWLAPPKEETEKKPRVKKQRGVRPNLQLRDWPEAQRKANDLLLAVKGLRLRNAVGTDVLIEPAQELAGILGFDLVKKK